jgi:hypothetical protein
MTITTSPWGTVRVDWSQSSDAPEGWILVSAWSQPCRKEECDPL